MSKSRASGMNTQVTVIISVLYVAFTVFTLVLVRTNMTKQAVDHAVYEAEDTLARYAAVDAYFTTCLQPGVRAIVGDPLSDDYYDPCWMSTRYAVRAIEKSRAASDDAEECYFREVCVGARVPDNEADAMEAAYFSAVSAGGEVEDVAEIREIDGKRYYVVMRVGERFDESCMRCHGSPEDAPAELIQTYGSTGGFNKNVGDVAYVLSTRIPMTEDLSRVDFTTYGITGLLGALFVMSVANAWIYNSRRVVRPLRSLNEQAEGVASGDLPAGTRIVSAGPREVVDLAESFSEMSHRVADTIAALEVRTGELESSNQRLMSATAAKDEFLTNMSHDLRTPLNSVIGFSDVMLSELAGPVTEEQRKQLRMVKDAGNYLLALVDQILDLSRVENGVVAVECREFDVVGLLRRQIDCMEETARATSVEVQLVCAQESMPVFSDETKLRQIVSNIVGNAVKFSRGGSVTVSCEARGDEVVVSVADTGPGIAPDELGKVFDAFWQHKVGEQAKPSGSGLGLAIARRLARALGGDIDASSVLGEGSTFTVTVPRHCTQPDDEDLTE